MISTEQKLPLKLKIFTAHATLDHRIDSSKGLIY